MSNLTLYLCSEAELPKEYKYIKFNDAYFNNYYTDYKIDAIAKNIIKSIDDVEYTGNYRFKSKFEEILKLNSGNAHLPYAKTAVSLEHTTDVYTASNGIHQINTKSELRKALASYFKER